MGVQGYPVVFGGVDPASPLTTVVMVPEADYLALEKGLAEYGGHKSNCRMRDPLAQHPWPIPCTCGWNAIKAALLSGAGTE